MTHESCNNLFKDKKRHTNAVRNFISYFLKTFFSISENGFGLFIFKYKLHTIEIFKHQNKTKNKQITKLNKYL